MARRQRGHSRAHTSKDIVEPLASAGIFAFSISLLGSIWALGPSVSAVTAGLKVGMVEFADKYLYQWNPNESGIDHSAFAVVKLLIGSDHAKLFPVALNVYLLVVAGLFFFAFFWRVRYFSELSQSLLISVASVWLFPLSHDYTLVHLFAPLAALTLYAIQAKDRRGLTAMFACFGVIFATLTFVQFDSVRYGGQVRCAALAILFILALRYNLPEQTHQT